MTSLSLNSMVKNHKELWNWIADETEKQKRFVEKEEYFKLVGDKAESNCSVCEYTTQNNLTCHECPIVWESESGEVLKRCLDNESPYYRWDFACRALGDWKEAARLARIIANLPVRRMNETETYVNAFTIERLHIENGKVKLAHVPAGTPGKEIKTICVINEDGSYGSVYNLSSTGYATCDTFSLNANEREITVPTLLTKGTIVVSYIYRTKAVKVECKAEDYPIEGED